MNIVYCNSTDFGGLVFGKNDKEKDRLSTVTLACCDLLSNPANDNYKNKVPTTYLG